MLFTVVRDGLTVQPGSRSRVYLYPDAWDDWFEYRTLFTVNLYDENGGVHQLGGVKIGQFGLLPSGTAAPGQRVPEIPNEFDALDERFFSIGTREDYYLSLNNLSEAMKTAFLRGIRDCAYDLQIFEAARQERSMFRSLLRDVDERNVRGRFHRITQGNVELTRFQFSYTFPAPAGIPPAIIDFDVIPESQPPTNVHVLIGRNGVGKTECMRNLTQSLLGRQPRDGRNIGRIQLATQDWSFASLVMVSFSAFDDFDLSRLENDPMPAHQVGLRREADIEGEPSGIKAPADLAADFMRSFGECRSGLRASRWRSAIETLEIDDLFAEANVTSLLEIPEEDLTATAIRLFKRLSSGHAIILLTITRLVELVDEKTFVVLDEPEGHLHPPLLSAFVRALSDLLVKRNGVALIATHSPVVLQEVPRSCAWKLRRGGAVSVAERPTVETFGENIGVLTREVFGLEVTRAGFHNLLRKAVAEGLSYADTLNRFHGQLGTEGRAIVQALIAGRDAGNDSI